MKKIKSWFKGLVERYFDYKITGEYYDMWRDERGVYHYQRKYNKKYFLKCFKKQHTPHTK